MNIVDTVKGLVEEGTTEEVDTVVAGAGVGGLALTAQLGLRRDHRVMLVDTPYRNNTSALGSGNSSLSYASGELRTMTEASAVMYRDLDGIRRIMLEIARQASGSDSPEALDLSRPLIVQQPSLWIASTPAGAEHIERETASSGYLRAIPTRQVREYCDLLRPEALLSAAVEDTDATLNNAGLHHTYVMMAELYPHVKQRVGSVTRVRPLADGTFEVDYGVPGSPVGRVRCRNLVNATGPNLAQFDELVGVTPVPLQTSQRSVFVGMWDGAPCSDGSRWPSGRGPLIIDAAEEFYFREEPVFAGPHVLRASPCDSRPSAPPSPWHGPGRPSETDVRRAHRQVESVISVPLWIPDGGTRRGGTRGFCADGLPAVGRSGAFDRHGYYYMGGLGAVGFQTSIAFATCLAAQIEGLPVPAALREAYEQCAPGRYAQQRLSGDMRPARVPVYARTLGRFAAGGGMPVLPTPLQQAYPGRWAKPPGMYSTLKRAGQKPGPAVGQ